MSQINKLIPGYYKKAEEFQALSNALEIIFDNCEAILSKSRENQFPQTASEEGLYKFEAIYNIYADSVKENEDFRRKRIISRAAYNPPYNEFFLNQKLNALIGAGNYTVKINYELSELYISFALYDPVIYKEAVYMLRDIIPAHICPFISLKLVRKTDSNIFTGVMPSVYKNYNVKIE